MPNTLALVINVRHISKGLHCISKNSIGQSLGLKVGKLDFYRQISTSNARIWFHLYDSANGLPYMRTAADKVSVPVGSDIAEFRDAVKLKYDQPGYLKDIPSGKLLVFQNKQSFDKRDATVENGVPLDEESSVDGLGKSKDDALIVAVPSLDKKELEISLVEPPSPLIWFHLYDYKTGLPYKNTNVTSVSLTSSAFIDQFRDAVKLKCSNKLSSIDASDLLVFQNKQSFDKRDATVEKEDPLKSSCKFNGLGETEEDALIVAVGYKVKAVWNPEPKIVYSLHHKDSFFVNREKATEQLNEIHSDMYNRASRGRGVNWVIPLADNVWGLGKHYIAKSREQWKDSIEKGSLDDFQKTLCACHTIYICFSKNALICNDMDAKILECLQNALKDRFKVPPDVLSNPAKDTESFLNRLVDQAGPVFIALDEIGGAFESENLSDAQRRDKFMFLCTEILSKWLIIPKVFFVLTGRGSFHSYVGLRPNGEISGSRRVLIAFVGLAFTF